MKLWLITREEPRDYDVYLSAVVAAASEDDARRTHPEGGFTWEQRDATGRFPAYWGKIGYAGRVESDRDTWIPPEEVSALYIGESASDESGVILASFKAG